MPLRVRAEAGARREWHELPGPDLAVGSDPSCDLQVIHPSVAPQHARILTRRGRVLAVDLGRARRGTVVAGRRIDAPVVVAAGEDIRVGEVRLRVEALPEARLGPSRRVLDVGLVGTEIDPGVAGVRRFLLPNGRELVWARTDACSQRSWAARVGGAESVHAAEVVSWTAWAGRPCLVEQVPPGVRLGRLLEAERSGQLEAPLGARALIAAHLARALAERHALGLAHGSVSVGAVHLSREGSALLLSPGPEDGEPDGPAASAARRHGQPARPEDDRVALAELAVSALRLNEHPAALEVLHRWAGTADPAPRVVERGGRPGTLRRGLDGRRDLSERAPMLELRPSDILEAVRGAGVDPAPMSLRRLVRVLQLLEPGPIVALSPRAIPSISRPSAKG